MDNPEEFRCISLCTGYAGLELGLKRVIPALRTVCYVEVEAFACANLVAKIEAGELDAAPIWTDIKTFNGALFRSRVHIITAGYPCQPFSVAGKRKGTADPRHLWPHIERIVQAVRPLWCFFENVSGHLSIGFPEVYRSLRLMGYKVEAGLFTAAEVGAPHKRERLFILAHAEHNGLSGTEEPRSIKASVCNAEKRQDNPSNSQRADKPSELANTKRQRPLPASRTRTGWAGLADRISWPSRPEQPQYEWEEPRVVEQPNSSRPYLNVPIGQSTKRRLATKITGTGNRKASCRKGQAQSRLGRAASRTSSRVDRLRLLGNGVVPQQAEKAFRELIKLF